MIRNRATPTGAALGREIARLVDEAEPRGIRGARRSRIVYPRCGRSRLRRGTRFAGTFPAVTATIAALLGCAAATSSKPNAAQATAVATTKRAKRLRISGIGSAPIGVRVRCYVERIGGVIRFAGQPWSSDDEEMPGTAEAPEFPKSSLGPMRRDALELNARSTP